MARDKDKMKCNSPRRITKGEAGHGRKSLLSRLAPVAKRKIVMFGDANMEIKKDNPERHKKTSGQDITALKQKTRCLQNTGHVRRGNEGQKKEDQEG